MKTCPICNARAFDDATTCFGCMHRFEEGPAPQHVSADQAATTPAGQDGLDTPAFLIRMIPLAGPEGRTSWSCSVDVVGA